MPPRPAPRRPPTTGSTRRREDPRRGATRGATPRGPEPAAAVVSLPRALSKLGLCSRSEGEQAVRDGRVRVNGRLVTDGRVRVRPDHDTIVLDGAVAEAAERVYVMLNKPRGVLTTRRDPRGRGTVYACLDDPALPFLGPVGRLDQASEGLLLFTNDTQWANAITAPERHVRKTYHVQIDRLPDAALLTALRAGVDDGDDTPLRATSVEILRTGSRHGWLSIELDEGRNRQIRRMLAAQGVQVLRLVRVAIGALVLGELPKGSWRHLTAPEVMALRPADGAGRAR